MYNSLKPNHRRRGSVYLAVLGASMLLATIGFSALTVARIRTREIDNANHWAESNMLAFSSVEYGVSVLNRTPGWRTMLAEGGNLFVKQEFGGGSINIALIDEIDGDIASGLIGPLRLYGIGQVGEATRVHSVLIAPDNGLDILRMAIHAGTQLEVKGGKEAIPTGAAVSSNGNTKIDGIVYGDVQTLTTSGSGVTTGTTTTTAPRQMPDPGIFNWYMQNATEIPYTGNLVRQVLTPTHNPWGQPNEDGLYFLDTLGHDLDIEGCRINGTLVVRAIGKWVSLEHAVFLHNSRSDYPTLIVDGHLELDLRSEDYDLSEADYGVNFNPAEAPYDGDSDTDLADTYPNEIHGLIHALGQVWCDESTRIRGMLLGESTITVDETIHVIHNRDLYENPPLGYGDPLSPVITVPNTWQWDAMPNIANGDDGT